MAEISTATRKGLPAGKFALPSLRKYPIHDAAHTRNAAARLEQNKGRLTPAQYAEAKRNIGSAAKKFGIDSEFAKKPARSKRKGLRMKINTDGSMEVHHLMAEIKNSYFGPTIELSDDLALKEVWNKILYTGTFRGYRDGPFSVTEQDLDDIVTNSAKLFSAGHEIPIDYEHASEAPATAGSIATAGAPAQGWIKSLDKRGSELWALMDFNQKAREQIKAGEYKYLSPAFRQNQKDKVTGAPIGTRLTSLALTNIPFLDGLPAIAARDFDANPITEAELKSGTIQLTWLQDYGSNYDLPGVRKALKLDDFASLGDMSARCARLREIYANPDESAGMDINSVTAGLREFTQVPLHSDVGEALDAIEAFIDMLEGEDHEECCPKCDCECVTCPNCGAECCPCCGHACPAKDEPTTTATDKVSAGEEKTMDTILLSEHKTKVAELELQLKDETSKREAAEAQVKTLTDAEAVRVKAERTAKVELAFTSYKDTRKLTDADKEAMQILLDNGKDELFNKLYPPIAANLAHLTQRLTTTREIPAKSKGSDVKSLADKYMKEGKSYDEAYTLAMNEATGTTAL